MKLPDKESLYLGSPTLIQDILLNAEGFHLNHRRYSGSYRQVEEEYLERDRVEAPALEEYRRMRLKAHFKAASASPYWKIQFQDYGVNPDSSDPFSELKKLPIISKLDIRERSRDLRPNSVANEPLVPCHTSGTTGAGLVFYETRQAERERWANWWRYRLRHGVNRTTWCGYFGGRSVVPISQGSPPYWRVNYFGRQVMFSGYHLRPSTANDYVACITQRRLPWLHGYPSSLALLATYILEMGLNVGNSVRVVTTGAESLLAHQKAIIEQAFRAPVREHYGQAEGVANISMCEVGSLHIDEDYSHVELIGSNDCVGSVRIVGSNWTNPAFPLFRYDTGDLGLQAKQSCSCGRFGRTIASIDGRIEEAIVLPNGTKVGRLDHIFKDCIRVAEAQIEQCPDLSLTFRVVKGHGYSETLDEQQILSEARKRLGQHLPLRIHYVSKIERSSSGKIRFVVRKPGNGDSNPRDSFR